MDSVQSAFEIVKHHLERSTWKPGERLPALKELAEFCHVSRNTMWKALALLKAEHLVTVKRRGAIIAGQLALLPARTVSKSLIWQRLKAAIARDILSGAFKSQQLPLVTKLAAEYGVSLVTLKKALTQLVEEGIVVADGHNFRIPQKHVYASSSILFIAGGNTREGILADNERIHELAKYFERESPLNSNKLMQIGFDCYDPRELLAIGPLIKSAGEIAGVIVSLWYPWEEIGRTRWHDLLELLIRIRCPVVVVDQSGDLVLPAYLQRAASIKILRISGIRGGEIVADFLLRNHHTEIAYISPNLLTSWAHNRYTGLCRHIEHYGQHQAKVHLVSSSDPITDSAILVNDLLAINEQELKTVFGARYSAEGLERLTSALTLERNRAWLESPYDNIRLSALKKSFSALSLVAKQKIDNDVYFKLFDAWYDRASTFAINVYMQSFFEDALKQVDASAWVCSDSKTGHAAYEFLTAKGIPVPRKIALICFDNWAWSLSTGVSTYDFNMNGMARKALSLIIDKKEFSKWPKVTELDGYVVDRKTTNPMFS